MPIYNRHDDLVSVVAKQDRDIAEIKQAQIVGGDNLVVKQRQNTVIDSLSVPSGTYVEYTATFTYENPPSDALVMMTFSYSFEPSSGGFFITEYTPVESIGDSYQRKFRLRAVCITGTMTGAFITAFSNCTESGSLSLVRTL